MITNPTEIRRHFSEEGYVILPGILPAEVIQGTRRDLNTLVDQLASQLIAAGKISDPLIHEPFETRLYRLYENHLDEALLRFRPELHLPELFHVFFNPRLLDTVELLLGDEILLYPNYTARLKYPRLKRADVLWHQDGGYTEGSPAKVGGQSVDQLRMVNMWTPLVPAHVEHGCMQFIPGSHKLGVVPHAPNPQYGWLEIAPEYLQPRLNQATDIELEPGDVVLFHNLLFHQGQPNRSNIIRWSIDWRYLDANQSTLRKEKGHLARSRHHPSEAVQNPADWAARKFI